MKGFCVLILGAMTAALASCGVRTAPIEIIGLSDPLTGRLTVVLPEAIRGREINILAPGNQTIARVGKGQSFVITCEESSLAYDQGVVAVNPGGVVSVTINVNP